MPFLGTPILSIFPKFWARKPNSRPQPTSPNPCHGAKTLRFNHKSQHFDGEFDRFHKKDRSLEKKLSWFGNFFGTLEIDLKFFIWWGTFSEIASKICRFKWKRSRSGKKMSSFETIFRTLEIDLNFFLQNTIFFHEIDHISDKNISHAHSRQNQVWNC